MRNRHIALLLISLLLGQGATLSVPVILHFGLGQFHLMNQLGADHALAAFSYGSALVSLSLLVAYPFLGKLVDYLRANQQLPRPAILLGSAVGGLGLFAFALANTQVMLYGAWLLLSLGYALAGTGFGAVLPVRLQRLALHKVSGLLGAAIPLVIMLVSLLMLAGLKELPLTQRLLMLAGVQWACVAFALFGLRDVGAEHSPTPDAVRALEPDAASGVEPDTQSNAEPHPIVVQHAYRQYYWVLLGRFLLALCTSGQSLMSLYYLARFNLDQQQVLQLNGLLALGVFITLASGAASVYFSRRSGNAIRWLIWGALAFALSQLGQASASSLGFSIASSLLAQLALGICHAQGLALLNRSLPSKQHFGRDIAWGNVAQQAGSVLIHFVAPSLILLGSQWMADDGYSLYFLLLGVACILYSLTLVNVARLSAVH
ncbi:hypothetical protein JYB87_14670 [Shewanella avicenniae]|uniref:Major Facilitator Superfamily protein n=1 Tax=Shewanella avicenniae TaxID=2814294 RepID=A0ABX7QND3_9GAMM|nr:hypothetical protein [Shewanella avicenniae]QSX32969.1 hypothetical protein JYB87_14670 [Shewanella avicenniae]